MVFLTRFLIIPAAVILAFGILVDMRRKTGFDFVGLAITITIITVVNLFINKLEAHSRKISSMQKDIATLKHEIDTLKNDNQQFPLSVVVQFAFCILPLPICNK